MKTLWEVKGASHKRPHIIRFHLYEISRIGKSIVTESRLSGCQGFGEIEGLGRDC